MSWDHIRTIMQGVLMLVAVLGVLGALLGNYNRASVLLAEYDLRMTTLEHDRDNDRKSLQTYQDEMRLAVARAVDLLTDVRLQIAKTGGSHVK